MEKINYIFELLILDIILIYVTYVLPALSFAFIILRSVRQRYYQPNGKTTLRYEGSSV